MTTWLLAVTMLVAAGWHLFHLLRSQRPACDGRACSRRDARRADVAHAAMGASMAVVLVVAVPRAVTLGLAALFVLWAVWLATRLTGRGAAASYAESLRLAACTLAMAVMFAVPMTAHAHEPAGAAPAVTAAGTHTHAATEPELGGHDHATHAPATNVPPELDLTRSVLLALLLLQVGLAAMTAVQLRRAKRNEADRGHLGGQLVLTAGGAVMAAMMM